MIAATCPTTDFWHWWTDSPAPAPADVDRRVHAIHPGLAWEFSDARTLTVHAAGDPTLRALAARWAAAAPPSTAGWRFLDTRPSAGTPLTGVIRANGSPLDLSRLRFEAHPAPDRPELDIVGVHPAFARLDPATATRTTALALTDVLGDALSDLWIGHITVRPTTPADVYGVDQRVPATSRSLSAERLLQIVEAFSTQERRRDWTHVGDAMARWPLRAARWPRFDTHLVVTAPPTHSPDPSTAPLAHLTHAAVADLARLLGADGTVVAWENAGRVAHVYADGSTTTPALVEAATAHGTLVERGYDPTLAEVSHLAHA